MNESRLIPKLLLTLKSYSRQQFINDLISGIIVAIIALPLSIALALASGVKPEQGLYTAIVAGFVISFLGGSTVQIAGPTAAFATIVAGIVATSGIEGLAIATIMAGIMLILMGVFRLGNLIRFIPCTITTGFTSGIAVTILIGQLKDFFGLTFEHAPVETMEKVAEVVRCFGTFNPQAALVGALALAILIIMPKFVKKVPPSLVAIIVCAAVVKLGNLEVNTIGDLYQISSSLPPFALPNITLGTIRQLLPDAFTIAILAAIESLLSCVVADGMTGHRHNSNMELVAQGAGNICSALFGGIPATGAIARTAANIKNGGRTPVAGMVHALVLLGVLVVFMPYASLIPMPAIAAILFVVAYNMSEWRQFVSIIDFSPKSDIIVLITTFVLTVVFDLVVAICIGLLLSVILFMKRMSEVTTVEGWTYVDDDIDGSQSIGLRKVPKGAFVYEITGPVFFGVSDKLSGLILETGSKVVIIRMKSVPAVDATGILAFESLIKVCKKKNIQLILSHLNEQPMKAIEKSGLIDKIGADNLCANIDEALARAERLIAK
ncbi:MAG: STAS domain-containing protein [Clostridia bacterium]|nr:STAS domain-containing protein [Clostridia bacterium]